MNRHEQALAILKSGTIIPANPLALNENRKFDEKGQRLLSRYYLNSGCGGLAVAVHTTQFEIRLPQYNLYETVLKTAIEEITAFEQANDKVIVRVGGVCGPVEQALREAEICSKMGYDAVLLSPGGLSHLSEAQLISRTKAVAKLIPVIGFYLQPAVGGRTFTYNYWQEICKIKGVVAIKCASFNRYTTLDVVRAVSSSARSDEIALYTGNDDNIVLDLLTTYKFTQNGVTKKTRFIGGLLGHWSVWSKTSVDIFNRLRSAAESETITPELLTLAAEVTDTNAVFFDTANQFKGCIAGLHEVLRRQGLMKGIWCLNPSETLSQGQLEEIDRVYKMYPHLCDDFFIAENIEQWKKGL